MLKQLSKLFLLRFHIAYSLGRFFFFGGGGGGYFAWCYRLVRLSSKPGLSVKSNLLSFGSLFCLALNPERKPKPSTKPKNMDTNFVLFMFSVYSYLHIHTHSFTSDSASSFSDCCHTHRLYSSSFLGYPYEIVNMNHKKELLWSL